MLSPDAQKRAVGDVAVSLPHTLRLPMKLICGSACRRSVVLMSGLGPPATAVFARLLGDSGGALVTISRLWCLRGERH